MKPFILADNIVIAIRLLCITFTILSTVRINQTSFTWSVITLVSFYLLKKRSKHYEQNRKPQIELKNTEQIVINRIDNPYKKHKKLHYSQLPPKVLEKAQKDLLSIHLLDYSYSKCLNGFQTIKSNTECIFAKKSRLWGAPKWNIDIEPEENIKSLLPSFILFCNFCMDLNLDGYVIELPGWIYGDDLKVFSKIFCQILETLSDVDPGGVHCMNTKYVDRPNWVFEFCKTTFFITTFAPCYEKSHPRYAFEAKNCYILFQPELSFALHDLPSDTPNTEWEQPVSVRDKIRVAYRNAGRPYLIRDTIHYPMAYDMIRPLKDEDGIVKWWLFSRSQNAIHQEQIKSDISVDGN